MNPIKVKFVLDGTLENSQDKESVREINRIIDMAYKMELSREIQIPYNHHAQEILIPHLGTQIIQKIIEENSDIIFYEGKIESIEITHLNSSGHKVSYEWVMKYKLESPVYICLNIFPDKAICYQESDKEIKFVSLENIKVFLVEE